jgi:hypothetical protein
MDVEYIFNALIKHTKTKDIQRLNSFLELAENTLYTWKKRNKIAKPYKILSKLPEINVEWLRTGEGPMLLADKITANPEQPCPTGSISTDAITPHQNLEGWTTPEETQRMIREIKHQEKIITLLEKQNANLEQKIAELQQAQRGDSSKKNAQM